MNGPGTEDRLAIIELYARYSWALDTGDTDGYVALFTEDGEVSEETPDGTIDVQRGHAGIRKLVLKFHERPDFPGHQHQMAQFVFEPDPEGRPDHWVVRSYAWATINRPPAPPHLHWCGHIDETELETIPDAAKGNGAPKRTRETISAEANKKRQDLRDAEADINQIETLHALEKYKADYLTPDFMASLGMKQYVVENTYQRRHDELSRAEVVAEDEHDPDTGELPERDHAFDQSLCDELILRVEGTDSAEALHRLANDASFKSAVARLPASMQTTVRRYWKSRLEKAPVDA